MVRERGALTLQVDFVHRAEVWRDAGVSEELLAKAASRALAASGWNEGKEAEVAVLLTDDEETRRLNAAWRDQIKATNVLSFPLGEEAGPQAGPRALGDIVLAFETVRAESLLNQKNLNEHAAHLVVHGLLHLLGYDHQNDEQARAMESLEQRVLSELGIADPYDGQPDKSSESTLTAG